VIPTWVRRKTLFPAVRDESIIHDNLASRSLYNAQKNLLPHAVHSIEECAAIHTLANGRVPNRNLCFALTRIMMRFDRLGKPFFFFFFFFSFLPN
jgi:hypothetical protein